jgi:hypothetical protein
MHHHVWEGHLQYLQKLYADLADEVGEEVLPRKAQKNGWQETIRFPANSAFSCFEGYSFWEEKPLEPDGKWMLYTM